MNRAYVVAPCLAVVIIVVLGVLGVERQLGLLEWFALCTVVGLAIGWLVAWLFDQYGVDARRR